MNRRDFICGTASLGSLMAATVAAGATAEEKSGIPAASNMPSGKDLGKARVLPPGRYDEHMHIYEDKDPKSELLVQRLAEAGLKGGCVYSREQMPSPRLRRSTRLTPEQIVDNVIEWCSASPTLYPFFWIDPSRHDSVDLVDMAVEKGIYGFKVIRNNGMPCDGPALECYRRMAHWGRPVTFHSGILYDGVPSSEYFRPLAFEPLLRVPRLKFCLAHVSWPWCDECIAVYGKLLNAIAARGENVPEMFIDTTPGTPKIYRREALAKVFTIGYDVLDHVQFGTDCNAKKYNVDWCADWMRTDDAVFGELGLDAATVDSNYRGSLQRYLFGGDNKPRKVPVPDGTLGKRKGNDIT